MAIIHQRHFLPFLIALALGVGSLQAANSLTVSSATINLACDTSIGPAIAVPVLVQPLTPLAGSATLNISLGALAGGVQVSAPASQVLSASNTSLTYSFSFKPGCAGATTSAAATQTIQFKTGTSPATADVTVRINATVTTSASALTPSPNAVILSCVKNGTTYTPGTAQAVSVTSAANGGTPFKIDNTSANLPTWLTVSPTPPGNFTASTTPASLTIAAANGCGGFAVNTSHSATVHLQNAPAPDKLVPVTLQIVPLSPLSYAPASVRLNYTQGSGVAGFVDVMLNSNSPTTTFFTMDTSTFPIWLTVDYTAGVTPQLVRFSSTAIADTIAPGTYNATVRIKVAGYGDLVVPVSLLIANAAPTLSIAGGTTQSLTWTMGQPAPVAYITAVSSAAAIPYSLSTAGTLQPQVASNQQAGLAYSYGTLIAVTFNPAVFAAAQPGVQLSGTVTFTWGSPTSILTVDIVVTVKSAPAKVTALTPTTLPVGDPGPFTLVLSGSGFVSSTDPLQKTTVGIVTANSISADPGLTSVTVVNPSSIMLTISPGTPGSALPFTGSGGSVVVGVCNPDSLGCTTPTGTATLSIVDAPIIQAATSSSSFQQVTAPANPPLAPYDLISLFGSNFCSSGCGPTTVLTATPDPLTLRYPNFLSPDPAPNPQRLITVTFQTHANATAIANAPLLFATDNQINLIVPAAVSNYAGTGTVDIVVNFNTGTTVLSSAPFPVNVQSTNPGIFTAGASGQGPGAILSPN